MKSIVRVALIISAVTLSLISTRGQDSQFSQFYANPMYLNPALTGSHSGTYRIMANYRDQWGRPLDKPLSTISVGGDIKYNIRNKGSYSAGNDVVAIGLQFFSDRIGLVNYNTTILSAYGAYHKMLDKATNQYLSAGFQFGIAQRGITYNNLTFEDQFDGVSQYDLPSQEILPANSHVAPDIAMGLHYSITPAKNNSYYLGIAFQHFNSPNVSFFDLDNTTTEEYEGSKLSPKLTMHIGSSFPMGDFAAVEPRAIFWSQGISKSVVAGANLRYEIEDSDEINTHLGAWIRSSKGLTTWSPTDLILSAGIGKGGLLVGLSYDINLIGLTASSLGTSTFEISVSYIGNHDNNTRFCPVF